MSAADATASSARRSASTARATRSTFARSRSTNGRSYELTDIAVAKEARERIKASACARFTTVLGPASDGFHEGHVHVDIAERRSGYRICQWAVRDASDLVPLPRARPPEAPKGEP